MPGTPSSDAHVAQRAGEPAPPAPDTVLTGEHALTDGRIRRRLLWLVAAPAAVTALLSAAAAGYFSAGTMTRWDTVLVVGHLVAAALLVAVASQAVRWIRQVDDRFGVLRATTAEARAEVDRLTERLRQSEQRLAPVRTPAGRQVEVFVNLSRRLQSLVHREIKLLDALENEVEDPDLLKGLFQVDHLATRIRRHAENLAVLGGAVSRRQWSRPVALTEVLRSAIAEVEHYSRVKLVPPIEGTVPGHAVASIIHLVAELIENATMFASPQTQVLLRAQHVTAGIAVEVEDRGLGMQRADQEQLNRLLADPESIDLDELLADGRIGLFVVSMIARQHGVTVRLQTNIYGGTQAVVILPQSLLSPGPGDPAATRQVLTQHTVELAKRELATALSSAPSSWPAFTPRPTQDPVAAPENRAAGKRALDNRVPDNRVPDNRVPDGRVLDGRAADNRTGSAAATADGAAHRQPPLDIRPPLPRRHSQTHLAPQLQLGPPPPGREQAEGHNPGLMASFMRGVSRSEAEDTADQPRTNHTEGHG